MVRSIEPDFALVDCFTTNKHCSLSGQCRLTHVLQGGLASFWAHLNQFTLADLLVEPAPSQAIAMAWPAPVQTRMGQKL